MSRGRFFLKPAEILFSQQSAVVTTVLGSCVSMVLVSDDHLCWAVNHPILPSYKGLHNAREADGLYVDSSLQRILVLFLRQGYPADRVEVRLFGGGDVLIRPLPFGSVHTTVGMQNITMARREIERAGLHLVNSDTGGTTGRKLVFYSATGRAYLKHLTPVRK